MNDEITQDYLFQPLPIAKGYIGKRVHIDPDAYIGPNVSLLGPMTIEAGVIIEAGTIIGCPHLTGFAKVKSQPDSSPLLTGEKETSKDVMCKLIHNREDTNIEPPRKPYARVR